jgi:hypothetical protein
MRAHRHLLIPLLHASSCHVSIFHIIVSAVFPIFTLEVEQWKINEAIV